MFLGRLSNTIVQKTCQLRCVNPSSEVFQLMKHLDVDNTSKIKRELENIFYKTENVPTTMLLLYENKITLYQIIKS